MPTNSELKEAVGHATTGLSRNKLNTEFDDILKRLRSFGSDLKTTYLNIANERRKLASYGVPNMVPHIVEF